MPTALLAVNLFSLFFVNITAVNLFDPTVYSDWKGAGRVLAAFGNHQLGSVRTGTLGRPHPSAGVPVPSSPAKQEDREVDGIRDRHTVTVTP